jgi:sec-independent protein translocase protein TatC
VTTKNPTKDAPEEDVDEEDGGPEEDKPMTFWEHLDELRKRVTRALGGLIVGSIVAWRTSRRPPTRSWRTSTSR